MSFRYFALAACFAGIAAAQSGGLSLRDLDGVERSLAQYRGKIVVLNFWATWCEPCVAEMPLFQAAQQRYSEIVVIGASADDETTRDKIRPFVEKLSLRFSIWTGADKTDMQRFGLGEGLPVTAFLDRDGVIAFRILGPVTKRELEARIETLLGTRTARRPEALLDKLKEENHSHGAVGMEGASTVPS